MITLNTGEVIAGQHTADSGGHTAINIALNADGTIKRKPVVTWQQSIANMAVSTMAIMDVDLGEEWHQYTLLSARKAGVISAGEILEIWFSIDGIDYQVTAAPSPTIGISWTSASNAHMGLHGRVQGRYARVRYTNGSTQQSANAKLLLTAAPY